MCCSCVVFISNASGDLPEYQRSHCLTVCDDLWWSISTQQHELPTVSLPLLSILHHSFSLSFSHCPQVVEQMSFLIRAEDSIITEESFRSSVQFGSVKGGAIEGLLRLMNGIHTPQVTLSTAWPETAKNNYSVELHRFITKLTGNDR